MNSVTGNRSTTRHIWTIVLICCLGGCSLKVTYPFMDWWLSWTIRDYVSLDRTQRQRLETQLGHFHLWHQQTQLPQYAEFVEQLSSEIQRPISTEQLREIASGLRRHWLQSLDYLIDDMDDLFVSLTQEQWQELLDNLAKTQAQYSQPFLSKDMQARQKLRQQRFIKGAKRWIGQLTPAQKMQVTEWSHKLKPMAELNNKRQSDWSLEATRLFVSRHSLSPEERQARLRRLIINEPNDGAEDTQQSIAHNRQLNYQLLVDLHRSLTPKQQQKLKHKLKNYLADFHYLANKAEPLAFR